MNYVFFGTPKFAADILEKLIAAKFAPTVVICNPDRPAGRKKILTPPPVKKLIANREAPILIYQPENLSEIRDRLLVLRPDFAIVAAYGKILPKEIINLPKFGTIGVHPSLLPKYRGATPIQSAILNGDDETGVTLYLLDEKIDHGAIIATGHWPLGSSETYLILEQKLAQLAADLIIETVPKFLKGEIKPQVQNESQATFSKKFSGEDGFIDPKLLEQAQKEGSEVAIKIDRLIRALNPEPGVWTYNGDKKTKIKLLAAKILTSRLKLSITQEDGKKPRILTD